MIQDNSNIYDFEVVCTTYANAKQTLLIRAKNSKEALKIAVDEYGYFVKTADSAVIVFGNGS